VLCGAKVMPQSSLLDLPNAARTKQFNQNLNVGVFPTT
jgi:hypothetical protein